MKNHYWIYIDESGSYKCNSYENKGNISHISFFSISLIIIKDADNKNTLRYFSKLFKKIKNENLEYFNKKKEIKGYSLKGMRLYSVIDKIIDPIYKNHKVVTSYLKSNNHEGECEEKYDKIYFHMIYCAIQTGIELNFIKYGSEISILIDSGIKIKKEVEELLRNGLKKKKNKMNIYLKNIEVEESYSNIMIQVADVISNNRYTQLKKGGRGDKSFRLYYCSCGAETYHTQTMELNKKDISETKK